MQSVDVSTVELDRAETKLNDDNDSNDVTKPETLIEFSKDVVVPKPSESLDVDDGDDDMEVNFVENRGSGAVREGSENLIEGNMEVDFVENRGSRAVLEGSENVIEGRDVEIEDGNENEDMEVNFIESCSGAVLEGSENLVERGKGNSLEGEMGFANVKGGGVEDGKGGVTSEVDFDVVDNQGGLGKASFNSCAKKLFPKTENKDIDGMHVKASGTEGSSSVIGNVVEVNESSIVAENQAIGGTSTTNAAASDKENSADDVTHASDEENIGDDIAHASDKENIGEDITHVHEGRVSVPKGVSHGDKRRKKGGFYTYDLVWGKVRSHPWWPAQIFEPEDASEQAKKHFKPKSYLLAYFGDKSFAYNEETKLKPFAPHFAQMAKQSTLEAFQDAVDCALDEAARRAEFGLSCHCIADDVYSRLKIQVINNAGIHEKLSTREARDRFYTASEFEPVKFLDYVKKLAKVPNVEENVRLEHVVTHAQMSAFYRWKGCYHLAEFSKLIGYVNNEADAPGSGGNEEMPQIISDTKVVPREKMEEDGIRTQKRKKLSGDKGNTTKKVKRSSDSMRKKGKTVSKEDDSDGSDEIIGRKLFTSSVKRRKMGKLFSNDSKSKEISPQITPPIESKQGLRVGESMLRAALQLSQPSPLLKVDVSADGKSTKGNGKRKQRQKQTETTSFKKSSPVNLLSNFLLVAVDPLEEHRFLSSMIRFFSDFRESAVPSSVILPKREDSAGYDIVAKYTEVPSVEIADGSSSSSESKEIGSDGKITEVPELQSSMVPIDHEDSVSESEPLDKDITLEESPTALTLKFTDMDSIPTEAKLNQIFSAFGSLKESETEVLPKKNCARVVFKRRVDAETAFSSSGKFETFGASLVCYQLNYSPSQRKSPSPEAKRRRKDGNLVDGIVA